MSGLDQSLRHFQGAALDAAAGELRHNLDHT
jgi:hypothetical protein